MNYIERQFRNHEIKVKAILGFPLTARERAIYLLLIATNEEMKEFLSNEKGAL